MITSISLAVPAKTAPAMKFAPGPIRSHSRPAVAMASYSATPVVRWKSPYAVSRMVSGARSATDGESLP